MSVAQIEAAIKEYDPSLTIVITKWPTSDQLGTKYVQWVQASRANPQDPYKEEISAGFTVTQPGRAFYIGRHTDFHPEQRPVCGELLILGKSVIRHTQQDALHKMRLSPRAVWL